MKLNLGFSNQLRERERYLLLALNIVTYMCYGILGGSFGVSLKTIQRVFGLTTDQTTGGLSAQAIGGCLSAILASFTLDKFNRQKQYTFVTFSLSLLVFAFPFSPSFGVYLMINLFLGFFCTLIDCISNAWVVELFRPKEHIFLQILHFFYSFGTVVSPFLLGPFLDKPEPNNTVTTTPLPTTLSGSEYILIDEDMSFDEFNVTIPSSFEFISSQLDKSPFWKPIFAIGFFMAVCTILHLTAYIIKPYQEMSKKPKLRAAQNQSISSISNQDLNNNLNMQKSSNNLIYKPSVEKKSKDLPKGYYIAFVLMIVVIVTFEVGNETNATNFLPSFLKESALQLNQEEAAYVFAILQFMIAGCRFINIFLSFKVNTVFNIYFNFSAMLTGIVILLLFSQSSLLATKIGIAFLGLGYSSTYPLIISFVEQRITLTNRISSIMAFSSVFGLIISPLLLGGLIESNPVSFTYITFGVTVITILLFSVLYLMEFFRTKRNN